VDAVSDGRQYACAAVCRHRKKDEFPDETIDTGFLFLPANTE
jgi:hypothetical protein